MPIFLGASPQEPDDRELVALRAFAARIRAAWDAGGHITRDAVKAALDGMEAS